MVCGRCFRRQACGCGPCFDLHVIGWEFATYIARGPGQCSLSVCAGWKTAGLEHSIVSSTMANLQTFLEDNKCVLFQLTFILSYILNFV